MFAKSKIATVLLGITLLSTAALADGKHDSKTFLKFAGRNDMAEVSLANQALRRAANPDIQAYAKEIVADHAVTSDKITALAKTGKVTLFTETTPRQKSVEKKLAKLNDRDRAYDRAYIARSLENHEKAVKAFEKQAEHGTDADVRAFASETLPTLKKHLEMATNLNTKLNTKSNK